ncbi:uncharacterized protein LOC128996636 isoform X5 [Macrosteles quadrilineatus]|uniref:uncharacterized protein LOC128996636 isoform X5 n=1 Tax=Macrosteles quadrilineatus TaxID=74068 RepID=UPI0023E14FA9|nr:uncharacterized protein LOC128996636 isoform X5 [Macrosteles quadrilineatus]
MSVQPPRYTSTPRAGRDTANALQNFNDVSPIFSTEIVRKVKSSIPILSYNRSNGPVSSSGAKSQVSTSSNTSTVPTKSVIPAKPQTPKGPSMESRNSVDKVSTKSIIQAKPQTPKGPSMESRNSVDKVIESVIGHQPQKESTPPKDLNSQVPTKSVFQAKPQTPKGPSMESRNSVHEVIESVIGHQSQKESTPPKDFNSQVLTKSIIQAKPQTPKGPSMESRNSVDDELYQAVPSSSSVKRSSVSTSLNDSRTKTSRVSKISQRPSTLPVVPEETAVQGTSQVPGEDIFKHSKAQSGWLIPKETQSRISLKRKSSVPVTITKRTKKTKTNQEEDDASLFDSPELPNLLETSSLVNRRKTHVLKKKPVTPEILEEHRESLTYGIIALDDLNKIKNTASDTVEKRLEVKSQKTVPKTSQKTPSRNQLEEELDVATNSRGKLSNNVAGESKLVETKEQLSQGKNVSGVDSKKSEVEINTSKSDGQKKVKIVKKTVKRSNRDLNVESLENTRPKRTLRERKPNINYEDNSVIAQGEKENMRGKKREPTIKSSQEVTEAKPAASSVIKPSAKNKQKKNNIDKENTPQTGTKTYDSEVSFELEEEHDEKDVLKTYNNADAQEEKPKIKGRKKNVGNTKTAKTNNKLASKTLDENNSEAGAKEKEISKPSGITQGVTAVKSTTTSVKRKTQSKKQTSLANDLNQRNEEIEAAHVLLDVENREFILHGESSSNIAFTNKVKTSLPSEKKRVQTSVSKKHSAAVTGEDLNLASSPSKCDVGKQQSEYEVETSPKTVGRKKNSQHQSKVKPKSGSVSERADDKTNKLVLETQSCVSSSTGTKQNTEDTGSGDSHSESRFYFRKRIQHPVEFWKTQTFSQTSNESRQLLSSKKRKKPEENLNNLHPKYSKFDINNLFGNQKPTTQELTEGVTALRHIHIADFLMMGVVTLEPGAVLRKISTNTAYTVVDGCACVTINKVTKYFEAKDVNRRFFIPRNIDVSITNEKEVPLKMDFVKFKGEPY